MSGPISSRPPKLQLIGNHFHVLAGAVKGDADQIKQYINARCGTLLPFT